MRVDVPKNALHICPICNKHHSFRDSEELTKPNPNSKIGYIGHALCKKHYDKTIEGSRFVVEVKNLNQRTHVKAAMKDRTGRHMCVGLIDLQVVLQTKILKSVMFVEKDVFNYLIKALDDKDIRYDREE